MKFWITGETSAFLTDFSKAFDCINNNLLIAKLNAYVVEKSLLDFIHSYLTKRKQKTKIEVLFSPWEMLLSGLPQGSPFLGSLLFSSYISDKFFEATSNIGFAGYADNSAPYTYSSNMQTMLSSLQEAIEKLFQWFFANQIPRFQMKKETLKIVLNLISA